MRKKMLQLTRLGRLQQIYGLLIVLIILNGLLLYYKVFITQAFGWVDLLINIGALLSIGIGYFGGSAVAAIFGFLYIVWYTVWLTTYAPSPIWVDYFRIFLIPAICGLASYVHRLQKEVMVIYKKLRKNNYFENVNEDTGLPNRTAFEQAILKQEQIKLHYPSYHYAVLLIRIEFVDFMRDELGTEEFNLMIERSVVQYRDFLHYEEELFWDGKDSLMVLFPYGNDQRAREVEREMKDLSLEVDIYKDMPLRIKGGILSSKETAEIINKTDIKGIFMRLTQLSEEDIVSEYIR